MPSNLLGIFFNPEKGPYWFLLSAHLHYMRYQEKWASVFCASKEGVHAIHMQTAIELGREMAQRGLSLVYGGAQVGLMGAIAKGVLDNGGHAVGVLPQFLSNREIAHDSLSEMYVVDTMHQRKQMMYDRSDMFFILPGGIGTMDELFESLTWGQLGLFDKPVYLLNINGYYDHLLAFIDQMTTEGFLREKDQKRMNVVSSVAELFTELDQH